jgi:hypothetical protein
MPLWRPAFPGSSREESDQNRSYCLMPNHWHLVLWPERDVDLPRWSSLWRHKSGTAEQRRLLSTWPIPCPRDWRDLVNRPQTEGELEAIRRSVNRGRPYGQAAWIEQLGATHRLESVAGSLFRK